jgi:hypothetical protein
MATRLPWKKILGGVVAGVVVAIGVGVNYLHSPEIDGACGFHLALRLFAGNDG